MQLTPWAMRAADSSRSSFFGRRRGGVRGIRGGGQDWASLLPSWMHAFTEPFFSMRALWKP
eukprot:9472892-Pyramimonas_sp.AAC.1